MLMCIKFILVSLTVNCLITIVVSFKTVATVSRIFDKNGFHRMLRTEISVSRESMHFKSSTGDIACTVLLEETLPSGAFVDPYELESLRAFGGPDVLCLHDSDAEKPAYVSQPLSIFIFSHLHLHGNHWISNLTIPVHMRYQKPFQEQDYVTVSFSNPALFLRCPDAADTDDSDGIVFACDSMNQAVCIWSRIYYSSFAALNYKESETRNSKINLGAPVQFFIKAKGNLEVQVPVGRVEHLPFVTGSTILITLFGCIVLIRYVIHHVPSQRKSKDI